MDFNRYCIKPQISDICKKQYYLDLTLHCIRFSKMKFMSWTHYNM